MHFSQINDKQTPGTCGTLRIQWHFDTNVPLDPHETDFQRHLLTQDSVLLIYSNVIAKAVSETTPRNLEAIDIKMPLSLPYASVMEAASQQAIRRRNRKFIAAVLFNRTYGVMWRRRTTCSRPVTSGR